MDPLTLTIESRTDTGKGAARKLRASGLVPGVFYGPGAAPVSIAATPKALTQVLMTPFRRNALLKLTVAGQEHYAMVKELQVHPLSRQPLHFDLCKVAIDQPVAVAVPFTTEGRAKGVIAGGEITTVFRDLPVRCVPDQVPALIKVDVTNMELGDVVRVKDLQLPAGVVVTLDAERSLVACAEPRKRPEEEAAAEGGAAATPAATPAS